METAEWKLNFIHDLVNASTTDGKRTIVISRHNYIGLDLFEKTEVETIVTNGNEITSCLTNNGK